MQPMTMTTAAPPPAWVDAEEAGRLLGFGVRTIWRMTADGRLPQPMRLSRKLVRWNRETLLEHMRRLGPAALELAPAVVAPPVESAALLTPQPGTVSPPVEAIGLPPPPLVAITPAVEDDGDDEDDGEQRELVQQSGALRRAVAKRVRLLSPHGRDAGLAKAFAALEALTDAAGLLNIADLFTEPIAALWDALPPTAD